MFGHGIGAGRRSDRFGTWALLSFLVVFLPSMLSGAFVPSGLQLLIFGAFLTCVVCTIAAVVCGLVGLVSSDRDERRSARQGLLKAAPPALIGGFYVLVLLLFLTSDQPLFG
jgi:hypothetical protein